MSVIDLISAKGGWFKSYRHHEIDQLIALNHHAFVLLYVIARRANWKREPNLAGLGFGQAFIGDYSEYNMTEAEYRTAKVTLHKKGFCTFKRAVQGAERGTVATLLRTDIYDIENIGDNGANNGATTERQRSDNDKEDLKTRRQEDKDIPSQPSGVNSKSVKSSFNDGLKPGESYLNPEDVENPFDDAE